MTFEHKNHRRLFEALAILRDETGLRIPLVLSGRRYEPFWPTLEREIERLRLAEQVHVLGAVDDETLAVLFERALHGVPVALRGLGLPSSRRCATDCPSSRHERAASRRW